MAQLKMYWLPTTPIKDMPLPEGYSFSNFKDDSDIEQWADICRNGLVGDNDPASAAFDREIATWKDIDRYKDVFFLDYEGRHVGTITAFVYKETNIGDVHMVALRSECRGKGLTKYMMTKALTKLRDEKVKFVALTTGEARIAAVKSYLSAGFLPVEYDYGMEDRWAKVLDTYQMDSIQMLYDDATPYKVIYPFSKTTKKKVRFGVVGSRRGHTMMTYCVNSGDAELVAVCDSYAPALQDLKNEYGDKVPYYCDSFDELLKLDIDCVVLANYANEHAPLAIKAMKAGKHVLSEVLPVQNMKEAVELIETVEQTGKIYAYAENYCYMPAPKKIRWMFKEGWLGNFEYGEGEYMHNCEPGWYGLVHASEDHWRNTMSAFYYCTHSMGPLIHISGQRPVSVTGFEAPFNERMARMGAKAGPFAVEMVTLESGAILKSLHGVGPARNSIWYSCYGSRGRAESAREGAPGEGVKSLYFTNDHEEGDNDFFMQSNDCKDGLYDMAEASGHGGSDYYVMYNMVQAINGNKQADIVNVYEAMDMFLPGLFAYRSVLAGGIPMAIPNLRDKAEREKWRNDTACTDPKVAGDMLQPSYSKGNPVIPPDTYEKLKERQERAARENAVKNEKRNAGKK